MIRWSILATCIIGMRNRIAHAYSGIDLDIVWEVLVGELPGLIDYLSTFVPEMPTGDMPKE